MESQSVANTDCVTYLLATSLPVLVGRPAKNNSLYSCQLVLLNWCHMML